MVLCLNGDGCGETRDEAERVSESGRIDGMAPGPLGGCDATSMMFHGQVVGGTGSTRDERALGGRPTKTIRRQWQQASERRTQEPRGNAGQSSLIAGGRLKLPMNRMGEKRTFGEATTNSTRGLARLSVEVRDAEKGEASCRRDKAVGQARRRGVWRLHPGQSSDFCMPQGGN